MENKKKQKDTKRFASQLALGVRKYQKVYDRWKAFESIFNLKHSRTFQLNWFRKCVGLNMIDSMFIYHQNTSKEFKRSSISNFRKNELESPIIAKIWDNLKCFPTLFNFSII